MAFEASDGKKFSMSSRMRMHNRSVSAKQEKPAGSILAAPEGEQEGGGEEQPEQVAAEHGPAQHVEMQHDDESGMHSVHSVHPDGHEHHSEHGSRHEAHEHAKKLASADGEEPEGGDEEPEETGDDEAGY